MESDQGPAIAVDRSGNATAVWYYGHGQDIDVWAIDVWASRYETGSGWTAATAIEADSSSNTRTGNVALDNSLPALVVDTAGNGTVVFRLDDGQSSRIWANRYQPASGWGSAQPISTFGYISMPDVAIDSAGNITAVWTRDGQIWENRYTPTSGWGTNAPVEPGVGYANWPRVGLPYTITGTNFQAGATGTIGGVDAGGSVDLSTTISGFIPNGVPLGTALDVVVTNPDMSTATLVGAVTVN